jgi:glycosyltransferase involved in cell wall biosynthesis
MNSQRTKEWQRGGFRFNRHFNLRLSLRLRWDEWLYSDIGVLASIRELFKRLSRFLSRFLAYLWLIFMKTIVLFDQDLQHYRQDIYKRFYKEFSRNGYTLKVFFDQKFKKTLLDPIFHAISYDFTSFRRVVLTEQPDIIIQFVWLRYKFLLLFMLWVKLRGKKIIVWSHGINLQNKSQKFKNILYYIRQYLADALLIYTPEQKQFIRASKKKLFVANNTLEFSALPNVRDDKNDLKKKFGLNYNKVVLSVARFDVNNRKVEQLIELSKILDVGYRILIVGPGISDNRAKEIALLPNVDYKGPIFDQKEICEYYKMADVFVMPGAIGLAICQAFYFGTPCIVERVAQGPEAFYLKEGINGYYYRPGDIHDLFKKLNKVLEKDRHARFCENARQTIMTEGSIENMFKGFLDAIRYVEKSN